MMKWIIGKYKHVIVWSVVVIYLFAANQIYDRLILRDGKPAGANIVLPAGTKDVVFKLNDVMAPVRINGQDLYEIKGYAFKQASPEENDKITIILVSDKGNVAFPTNPVQYPNMVESYVGYTPAMNHAEFSLLLSKDVLKPGNYQIGILLEDVVLESQAYALTGSTIQKTPNTIKYIPAP